MKKLLAALFIMALTFSSQAAFAADEGLHLGGMDKDAKKAKIEANKTSEEAEKAAKKAEQEAKKAAKKADAEAKKAAKKAKKH